MKVENIHVKVAKRERRERILNLKREPHVVRKREVRAGFNDSQTPKVQRKEYWLEERT
ncbi:hypothetical protein [Thermococcus sp.]